MNEEVRRALKATYDNTVFKPLGIILEKIDSDETIVSINIDKRHLQPAGLVHGGIYVLLAETAASIAAICTIDPKVNGVVALEINANHVRSCKQGKIFAKSKLIYLGKKTRVYEIKITDQEEKLISISRCTIMVVNNTHAQ